jgi:hypothetical protein
LLATRELKLDIILENCILILCSALSLFQYFIFAAAYLEKAVSPRYVDGNGSNFLTVTLEMCGNSSFRLTQI